MANIVLNQSVLDSEIFKDAELLKVLLYIVLKSKNGVIRTSLATLGAAVGSDKDKVRRRINKLKSLNLIKIESDNEGTTILLLDSQYCKIHTI